jgi:hypothetical protein
MTAQLHGHGDPDHLDDLVDGLGMDNDPAPATHTLIAWWPINDHDAPWEDLVREADADLDDVARRAHARVVGPPRFRYEPGRAIPGAGAYRLVFVARVPARHVDNLASARTAALRLVSTHHSTQEDTQP